MALPRPEPGEPAMTRSRTESDRPRAARRRAARPVVDCLEGRLLLSAAPAKAPGHIRFGTPEQVLKASRQPTNSPNVPFLNTPPATITVGLAQSIDPGQTGVAASRKVTIAGYTTPGYSTVWLGRGPRGAFTTAVNADPSTGYYEFQITARPGDNLVRVFAGSNVIFNNNIDYFFSPTVEFHFTAGDPILAWDAIGRRAIELSKSDAPQAARDLAILHIAQHDAIASIRSPQSVIHTAVAAPKGASEIAAANAAGQAVLDALYPPYNGAYEDVMESAKAGLPKNKATREGFAVGRKAAEAVLAWRAQDGSSAGLSRWGNVTPFAISSAASFRPGPPPAVGSATYDAALEEVRVLGQRDSTTRTAEQTVDASFWDAQSVPPAGPGVWNQAAERLAVKAGRDLWSNARTFAKLDMAMADSLIVAYDAKATYDVARPLAAIRQVVDPSWVPLLATPDTPSYVSGQAAFANAAATVLTSEFGAKTPVVVTSPGLKATRVFDTATAAAQEAGITGVYGGVHFNFDVTAGAGVGDSVARDVIANFPKSKR